MKQGILVVSFGTSYESTLKKNIEAIENCIQEAFPNIPVKRAFTSHMIIKKLKREQGIEILKPEEALKAMIEEGYTDIYVQMLHVIPGYEFEKVKHSVIKARHTKKANIYLGAPLLNHQSDYDYVAEAFESLFKPEEPGKGYLLMGHGTEHFANAAYALLQRVFEDRRSDVVIANVEGYPEFEHVTDRLAPFNHLTMIPLMMVAGDHAQNDMAGDEEDSFKSQLTAMGKTSEAIMMGMGENPAIQALFVKRVGELIENAQ